MPNANANSINRRATTAARLFCEATQRVVRSRGASGSIEDQVGWNELDSSERQMLVDTFRELLPALDEQRITIPGGMGQP